MIRQVLRSKLVPTIHGSAKLTIPQRGIMYSVINQGLRLDERKTIGGTKNTLINRPKFANSNTRAYAVSTDGEVVDQKIDSLDENEYNTVSNEYLEALGDELEALSEDHPEVDAEVSHGVLTLVLPPHGTYVINRQPPNKQIWLSSPISGPKRYDSIKGRWVTLRDNSSLTELLESEISSALDIDFKFEDVEG